MAKSKHNVRDAKRPLRITITKKDVDGSKKLEPDACAAANAICRQVEHVVAARVHRSVAYVKMSSGVWLRYVTPQHLRDELALFDRAGIFDPGEYVLTPPKGAQQMGYRPSHGPKNARYTGRPAKAYHVLTGLRPNASKKFNDLD